MSCKLLGRLVIEASTLFVAAIVVLQILRLPGCYLLSDSKSQASDGNRSWKKTVFAESTHVRCCYMQIQLAVDVRSNHVADS